MTPSPAIKSTAPSRGAGPGLIRRSGNAEPGRSLGKLKVLIVEDEAMIAWALESLLEDLGHEVVDTVYSGDRAIASAADFAPDLALMDINLGPGMTGIEAAERIRSQGNVTVIFVSAYGDARTKNEIERRVPGAPLLTKPINAAALEASIRALRTPGSGPG